VSPNNPAEEKLTSRIGIVGCGRGLIALLDVLVCDPRVKVEWVSDKDPLAIAIKKARSLHIPFVKDYHAALTEDIDIIINLTGSDKVSDDLRALGLPRTEILGGASAMFLWQLVEAKNKQHNERARVLREHENLYHLGLIIENLDRVADAGYAIIDYAVKMLNMSAGSLAMYEEKEETMKLIAAKGFSKEFMETDTWSLRKGGLTGTIFNQKMPLFIRDLTELPDLNPHLVKEGVRSLIASPLIVEGKIVGILYVNDFKVRDVSPEELSIFSLLTVYAAMTLERVRSMEAMRVLTQTDGLTGLFNHRHLMDLLRIEHERGERYKTKYSIIMIDIDHFKRYNDNFGHLEGNKVLKEIARIFSKSARGTDTVSRFGGEEFCIIAPEIDSENVVCFANRLTKEIEAYNFSNSQVTISCGIASFPHDGDSIHDLMDKADSRLYLAKRRGRNQVCSGDP